LLNEGKELGSGEYVVSKPAPIRPVAQKTANPTWRIYRWLVNDKYLPRCALLLHNVKAFILIYDDSWQFLSSKIHIALLRLMRLPSMSDSNPITQARFSTLQLVTMSNICFCMVAPNLASYQCFPDARPQDLSMSIPWRFTMKFLVT